MTWSVKPIQWPSLLSWNHKKFLPIELKDKIQKVSRKNPRIRVKSRSHVFSVRFSVIYEAILNAHDAKKRTVFHAISYVQATPTQCSIVKLWKNSRKSINTNYYINQEAFLHGPKNNPKIYEIWKLEIRLLIWILSTTQLFKNIIHIKVFSYTFFFDKITNCIYFLNLFSNLPIAISYI